MVDVGRSAVTIVAVFPVVALLLLVAPGSAVRSVVSWADVGLVGSDVPRDEGVVVTRVVVELLREVTVAVP